jgi:hypothetical protein
MNDTVMRGLAVQSMKYFEEYVDAQIRSICVGMPASFRYIGYERCTVEEEFEYATKPKNTRKYFELAKTSKYLVKYYWEFTDEMGHVELLTKHIYLPYVKEGGLLHISGTEMHLIPVLSDKVFTPNGDSIFVRLVQDRNNFYRMYHTVVVDDRRESRHVAYAEIYRNSSKTKPSAHEVTTKAKTVLPHYLFARYGFTGTFQRYAGVVPVVGDDRSITSAMYPPEEWVICESTRIQPKKTNIDKYYVPTRVRIAVPRQKYTHEVECLIFGLFYVLDHFPHRFAPKFGHPELDKPSIVSSPFDDALVGKTNDMSDEDRSVIQSLINRKYLEIMDDCSLWMILIGHIRFSGVFPENRLLSSIQEHFETIEPYLDQAVKAKLVENNIHLENYFDLLYYIQVNFNRFILENERNDMCIYGKSLEILQYVAYDILYGITMMKFKINKVASRGNPLTLRDVSEPLRRIVRPGSIFRLQGGDKLVCEVVGYSGDHLYPKITSIVAEQENRAGGGRTTEKRIIPGPEHWLDLSMVFAGSVLNLPKSNPTPIVRINMYITIDEKTGTVIPNEKFTGLIQKYKHLFKH